MYCVQKRLRALQKSFSVMAIMVGLIYQPILFIYQSIWLGYLNPNIKILIDFQKIAVIFPMRHIAVQTSNANQINLNVTTDYAFNINGFAMVISCSFL